MQKSIGKTMIQKTTRKFLFKLEDSTASFVLFLLALIPFLEILFRVVFKKGLAASDEYTAHLVLWITFLGGIITSRKEQHLSISVGVDILRGKVQHFVRTINAFLAASITMAFAVSGVAMILMAFDPGQKAGIFSLRFLSSIMPFGYLVISYRFSTSSKLTSFEKKIVRSGMLFGILLAFPSVVNLLYLLIQNVPSCFDTGVEIYYSVFQVIHVPVVIGIAIAALFGLPLFIVLGGIAYILFAGAYGSLELIPNEAYSMLTGKTIAAIPMFTLSGFILSESKAGERLIGFFRAMFGWIPGGMAVVAVLVSAFFTTFTGASGVTILALGGLLSYILVERGGYNKKFALGLLTSSGSIGLLFPPSLPIILYGVVAQVSIKDMFIGGIFPGILLILVLSVFGIIAAVRQKIPRISYSTQEVFKSFKDSFWEILLPFVIMFFYFGGITTIVETGAVAVVYTLFAEMLIHKDIPLNKIGKVFLKSLPIIGGVLVILAASRALSYYIVDAEIPMKLTAWVEEHIASKYLFLILLNLALLITGTLMDIFSAIMVVVPLILPLGKLFGIDPVHLGIIFLANLELGYLTPPVGLNLFLAAYRFEEPLAKVYKMVIPFFIILLVAVLVITYIPWFSLGFLR